MSTFVSYAQNFEDVMLWRALKDVTEGFYIDVGANSPLVDSVSMAFYENGWRGINVEPSLEYVDELRKQRPRDITLHAAVSVESGVLGFYNVAGTGLSTLLPEVACGYAEQGLTVTEERVPVVTLDDVFSALPQADVHWMKVDVEGAEKAVLDSWKSSMVRPWIVLVESVRPSTHEHSHDEWEEGLTAKGYRFVYFDGLNRYYVSEQHSHLTEAFQIAPNVFDRFALNGTATSMFTALMTHRLNESAAELHQANLAALEAAHAHELAMKLAQESSRAELAAVSEELQRRVAVSDRARLDLQARVIQTLSEYRSLLQQREEANAAVRQHANQLALARAEADTLRTARADLTCDLQHMESRLAEQERALRASEARTHEILDSSSWKLTAPLRLLVAMMKGSRQGASKYLGETLRGIAQIPGARGLAARMIPEHSRLRRYLSVRVPPPGSVAALPVPVMPATVTNTIGYAGSERSRLVTRLLKAARREASGRELQV